MTKKITPKESKLLNLKEWHTLSDAARHLTVFLKEEVCEADVLQMALEGRLKLSVYFANPVFAKRIENTPNEKMEPFKATPEDQSIKLTKVFYDISEIRCDTEFVNDPDIITIDGVWNLTLNGADRRYVEKEFQKFTSGFKLTPPDYLDNIIVEGQDGQICELQVADAYEEFETPQGPITKRSYFPARALPRDSILVVRTQAMIELRENSASGESSRDKPLGPRAKTTYLNIIGALLEIVAGKSLGLENEPVFDSEAKLIDHLKQFEVPGLSKTNLEKKFAEAKKSFNN
jgi:hypothetical protein